MAILNKLHREAEIGRTILQYLGTRESMIDAEEIDLMYNKDNPIDAGEDLFLIGYARGMKAALKQK